MILDASTDCSPPPAAAPVYRTRRFTRCSAAVWSPNGANRPQLGRSQQECSDVRWSRSTQMCSLRCAALRRRWLCRMTTDRTQIGDAMVFALEHAEQVQSLTVSMGYAYQRVVYHRPASKHAALCCTIAQCVATCARGHAAQRSARRTGIERPLGLTGLSLTCLRTHSLRPTPIHPYTHRAVASPS